ncbi:hypothetical protein QIH93_15140 [Bradyrhizobium ottawaense]|uniref:hypothetical protein n=1 Tax=Bradyrhizobium ottawaense TaxID=931866 RepID=UPI002714A564|nr:hypothetical protein [Bradyrhizobium ottawaense]WLB49248.1 hypothetical protein QIH93_15140 [Bradyrhizobium ottawaense]
MGYIDRGLVAPALNDTSSAAANFTKLQAALTAGGNVQFIGSGVAYINAPLVIGSNTSLTVDPNLTIKQASGGNTNLVRSACYNRAWNTVTVSWTSGLTATVTWTGHGRSVNEPVWLRGTARTTDSAFFGIFNIDSVVDDNNFTVKLYRTPAASPSGTTECKLADENISIEGGIWDYNMAQNGSGTFSNLHAIILAGIRGLVVQDIHGTNVSKFILCAGAVRNFLVDGIRALSTNSDAVKCYGPAFDGLVCRVRGETGDDAASLQSQEPSAFSGYDFTGGGDILSCRISDVDVSTTNTTTAAVLYTRGGFYHDGIQFDKITNRVGYDVRVESAQSSETGVVGSVSISDVSWVAPQNIPISLGFTANNLSIDNVRIGNFMGPLNAPTGTAINLINVLAQTTIGDMTVNGGKLTSARADLFVNAAGTVKEMNVRGVTSLSSNNNGRLVTLVSGSAVSKLNVEGNYINGTDNAVVIQSGVTNTPDITLRDNNITALCGINASASFKAFVAGNKTATMTNGFIRGNGAAVVGTITSAGGNTVPTGKYVVKVNGGETINLQAWDFQVDVTAIARFDGGYCYNTNAAAGTLGAAGNVMCQGTAANSWRLCGDPTKQY